MSQSKDQKEICRICKKEVSLSHHSLELTAGGNPGRIKCHKEPVAQTDFFLKFVLEARASKREMLAEIDRLKDQLVLDEQAITTAIERKFEAKVKDAVDEKVKEDLSELEANFKKVIDDGERTRVQLDHAHQAQMLDKQALLTEISTQRDSLIVEKAELERKSFDLQLQIDELTEAHSDLKSRHKGLKDRSLDIVRMLISVGTRVVVLEEKTGVIPRVDPKRIFSMIMGEEYEEEVIPVSGLSEDPTPVPPPAPKADVEASAKEPVTAPSAASPKAAPEAPKAPAMVIETVPPPVQTAAVADQEDPEPDPDSYALSDDEGDGYEHQVDGDDDLDQEEESSSDEECRCCEKAAKRVYTFTMKDGTEERLTACDPRLHADALLGYLIENAVNAPVSADGVINLFTQIR